MVLKRAGGALPTGTEATRGVLARLADSHLERLHGHDVGVAWLDEVTTGRRWPISDARPAQAMRIPPHLPMTDLGCGSAGAESDTAKKKIVGIFI